MKARHLVLLSTIAIALGIHSAGFGATISVTVAADSGAGSLRAAIAAATTGDTITFSLPAPGSPPPPPLAAVPSIALATPLTMAVNGVTIDGTTQATVKLVEIDGSALSSAQSGLVITAANCVVRGLVVNRCGAHGIDISGNSNTVVGNYIGTNAFGTAALNNGKDGIHVTSANNIIGGTTAADRNVISGNVLAGIELTSATCTGNVVKGNYVGMNVAGNTAVGNFDGIYVNTNADGNTIGGTATNAGNVCSGNAHDNIHIDTSNNTIIQGNYVGVDGPTGSLIVSTTGIFGCEVSNCTGTLVGGTVAGARNVVGGNAAGIELDSASFGNTVQGNYSGIGADGKSAVGNRLHGIVLRDAGVKNNMIGGTASGAGNTVWFNGTGGIAVFGMPADLNTGNAILGNSIYLNGRNNTAALLGIDLVSTKAFPTDDGVTANHVGATTGANNLQNYPVLTSAVPSANGSTIVGTLTAVASTQFRIEFFASTTASGTGFGEGQTFLGFANVTTDANGQGTFSASVGAAVSGGQFVSATATDPGNNTSEFSLAIAVAPAPVITSSLTANGTAGTAFTYTITNSGTATAYTATGLPPGLAISGATISGTPTKVGTFPVTIGTSNSTGADSKTLTVIIAPISSGNPSNTLQDSDGDGFSDELETFLKTDPLSSASTPFGGTPAGTPTTISSPKLAIKLAFSGGGSDSVILSGTFAVAAGTTVAGKTLTVDVGGVLQTFTLDPRGGSKSTNATAKVMVKGTTAKFMVSLKKGTFATSLSDEGLTATAASKVSRTVPVAVLFNATAYAANVTQSYTAKNNKGNFTK